jgi:predicted alpha/beta-fold hydrolase
LADLTRIAIPTRILFAEDDPLIPAEVYRRAEYSSVTRVFPTQHGGHLGYLANPHPTGDPDWHWMDWRIVQWVRAADTDTFLPAGL